jgi:hypothetical protein
MLKFFKIFDDKLTVIDKKTGKKKYIITDEKIMNPKHTCVLAWENSLISDTCPVCLESYNNLRLDKGNITKCL